MAVHTINPATEELIQNYTFDDEASIDKKIIESAQAQKNWSEVSFEERAEYLFKFSEKLKSSRAELSSSITREMGKVKKEALAEIDKCATSTEYLAKQIPHWIKESEYKTPNGYHVVREPMGVLLGVMPWNFPLWQVARFAIPALMCGNSVLIKHAPNTWGVAEEIEEIFKSAFPFGLYFNLKIDVPQIEGVIANPKIKGVSLTGSRRAGAAIGEVAGRHIKKCVLELGGSDAYVILDDADVELAAEACAASRILNSGQSCVSAKRFIVTRKNVMAFTEAFAEKLKKVKFGDPNADSIDIGPLARKDLREILHAQVERSIAKGAKPIVGAILPQGKGYFYPASLLSSVVPGMPAFDEELFGPVAALIEAKDESEALHFANRSRFGLGGAIFSRDVERARSLAMRGFDSGMIAINDLLRSDASAPFGGVKDSGIGRELGREGSLEFTAIKTIFIKT